MVENKKSACLTPGSKRSSVDHYREAWNLMMRSHGEDIARETLGCPAVQKELL
jgi:hypothetical protein